MLTNAQIEILEIFKQDLSDDEMLELRRLLVAFKAERVSNMLNTLWEKNDWTNDTMQSWTKEHNRTPYKSQNDYLVQLHK
jgi:hypothetical protein